MGSATLQREVKAGVVWSRNFLDHTTPSAPSEEASRYFSCVAATPPPAEEGTPWNPSRLGLVAGYFVIFMTVIRDAPET